MSDHKHNQLLIGLSALIAGLVGTVATMLAPKRSSHWTDEAKDFAHQKYLETKEHMNTNMILGGLAGGIVAVATAMLLAPKSGSELIDDILHPFSDEEETKHPRKRNAKGHHHTAEHAKDSAAHSSKKRKAKELVKADHKTAAPKKKPRKKSVAKKVEDSVDKVVNEVTA